MQHAESSELQRHASLSCELHENLCNAGFTSERIKQQSLLVDYLEELYKDLYDQDQYQWFIAGSYGDVWGNNLFQFDGRTDIMESDIDWTCLMRRSMFHFKESCKCSTDNIDQQYQLSLADVTEGHIHFAFEHLREPAEPHGRIGMRPKVDECSAYPCCGIPPELLSNGVTLLGQRDEVARQIQLIQASRPGHESLELRFSFAQVEKRFMRSLTDIQGQLFVLLKYIVLHRMNIGIFAFKSYHAKTLLFYALNQFHSDADVQWKPGDLVGLLIRCLDLLIEFMKDCALREPEEPGYYAAMKSFFLEECYIYYHKKIFTEEPHMQLIQVIEKTKSHIVTYLEEYMGQLRPLNPNDGLIFHPYTLFPTRLTLQFHKQRNPDNLYIRLYNCLQELTVLQLDKKTEFLRHVESLPPNAFTASLCLKVMTHLKFGATQAAVDLLKKHQYHDALYQVPVPSDPAKLKSDLTAMDTAWCFAFTYDQMEPLDFPFLKEKEVYEYCIQRSNTYPMDVVVDFNCLVRVFYVLLCQDQAALKKWSNDLSVKKAPLSEVYLCHKLLTPKIDHCFFDIMNKSIKAGAYDQTFFAKLIDFFQSSGDVKCLETFCDWIDQNMPSAHFVCLYCVCRVPMDLLSNRDLLPRALGRALELTANCLSYQEYELLLKMRRRLCKLSADYLDVWREHVVKLQESKRLNVQEIFAFLKSARRRELYDHLAFALSLLQMSPKVLSFLKLKDYRLLGQTRRMCVQLQRGYLDVWLGDIRGRMEAMPADKAAFFVAELVSLIDCLSRDDDPRYTVECKKLLDKLAGLSLSKSDAAKVHRMKFTLGSIVRHTRS